MPIPIWLLRVIRRTTSVNIVRYFEISLILVPSVFTSRCAEARLDQRTECGAIYFLFIPPCEIVMSGRKNNATVWSFASCGRKLQLILRMDCDGGFLIILENEEEQEVKGASKEIGLGLLRRTMRFIGCSDRDMFWYINLWRYLWSTSEKNNLLNRLWTELQHQPGYFWVPPRTLTEFIIILTENYLLLIIILHLKLKEIKNKKR